MSGPRWRLCEGVLAQLDLPQAVLLDARRGEYFEVDPAGTTILRAVAADGTAAAAVAAVCAAFDVDPARAARDTGAFIDELAARGLVERDGG